MTEYIKTKDYLLTNQEFTLLYDEDADMLHTHPQPINLEPYYLSSKYLSHNTRKFNLITQLYKIVRWYTLHLKYKFILNYITASGHVLDIGAGTGHFIALLKRKHISAMGVEPNANARAQALHMNIDLYENIEQLAGQRFQVITLWHVLEHLPHLESSIKEILSLLEPQGTLIIAVPNYKSYDAQYYGSYWAAYDTPRHLWHFSRHSISKLFNQHGYTVIKTQGMLFDSFYVSLLSEKYKSTFPNYLNAFRIGLVSNFRAKQSKEYSSIIYVIKKTQNEF